ncbi:MAG: protein kinase domain-containing protein [Anaeromyxobacteraceae bacterium]
MPDRAAAPVPLSLSALLKELAHAPEVSLGSAWEHVLLPGAVVDRFELVREIGRGGFGVVWEAKDLADGRAVAFKAVRASRHAALREERLLAEAEVAGRLDHPNIVALHEVGRSAEGPYLVLELLRGESLAERLARAPLPLGEALRIAAAVCDAVAFAHARGVVHRDLKPANVFLCDDGRVKVLDFGLAHAFGVPRAEGGTPAYMAPEQRRGAPEDERSDVYALGALVWQLVTRELPFRAGAGARDGEPVPVMRVEAAPELGALLARMLDPDPVKRPRDGGEVVSALRRIQEELEVAGAPDAVARVRTRRRARAGVVRRRATAGALAAAVLAVAVVAVSPSARHRVSDWIRPARLPSERRLAVLPFREVGASPADAAFSAGLGEVVTNKLRQLEQFRTAVSVVAASEVLKEKVTSAREARSAFGATLAIGGSVHWERDRVVVTTELVDTGNALVVAARDVEAPRGDPALQARLLERIAEMLDLQLAPDARRKLGEAMPAPGAYEFYLQGRGYLQRYDRAENLDSAIAVLDAALAQDPAYALAHAGRAEALLRKYDLSKDARFLAEARASARRALDADDRLAPVQMTAGMVHLAAGEHADAIAAFQRALDAEPGSADALSELARAQDAAGAAAEAEATYRRAVQLRPDSWAAYKDLGVFYFGHGRLAEAVPLFERVVALTPDNYVGYANLGAVYLRSGRRDDAVSALRRSLELRATDQGWANLGAVFFYGARYAEARDAFRKAVDLNPTESVFWGNLADADRALGRKEEAAAGYREATRLIEAQLATNRRDPEAWARLAMHEAVLGRREGALRHIAEALRLSPHDGLVLFRSALVHEELGQRDEALAAIGAAIAAGHSREEIDHAPPLDELRRDPRYAALASQPKAVDPKQQEESGR